MLSKAEVERIHAFYHGLNGGDFVQNDVYPDIDMLCTTVRELRELLAAIPPVLFDRVRPDCDCDRCVLIRRIDEALQ